MNSVYYIFLVIVILSFITGLTITYIDNKKAESLEKEKKLAANKPVVESAAPSFVAQSNSFVPYAEPVYDNVVPYIPVEQN